MWNSQPLIANARRMHMMVILHAATQFVRLCVSSVYKAFTGFVLQFEHTYVHVWAIR